MEQTTKLPQAEEKDYIVWVPSLELGIPVIDNEHKKLVELCNRLYLNLKNAKNSQDWHNKVADALKECADYVQKHFGDEEKLLTMCNYKNYKAHKARHDEFTKKVLETVNNFRKITYLDALKFVKFLYDWILSHIACEDKMYVKPVLEVYRASKTK